MNRHERRAAQARQGIKAGSYAAPVGMSKEASENCRRIVASIMRVLGNYQPSSDADINDRALACFYVMCGELAAIKNEAQRAGILNSIGTVAAQQVEANRSAHSNVNAAMEEHDLSLDDLLKAGAAQHIDIPKDPAQH